MKAISHRGNLKGEKTPLENSPDYIIEAINRGFDVEVDVWFTDGLCFGHDKPEHKCSMNFLVGNSDKLWIHCKNLAALQMLNGIPSLNIFWHEQDDFALTSKGFIWTYPDKEVCSNSVIVVDDATKYNGKKCYGLCSDNVI
tara:strand:+ start:172 stop:594 length:423 start_codon:yes stop_codon:yes gene_type:complete